MSSPAVDRIEGSGLPLRGDNIDTDRIIPARFLKAITFEGLGDHVFEDDRAAMPDHPFSNPAYQQARIILANDNFGSGSSREHAVWVLMESGIRAVIAPSFGPIFFVNSLKNGLLPLVIEDDIAVRLRAELHAAPGSEIAIDLERQEVAGPDGAIHGFDIAPAHRHRLLEGLDDIDLTLAHESEITAFEKRHAAACGWLFP